MSYQVKNQPAKKVNPKKPPASGGIASYYLLAGILVLTALVFSGGISKEFVSLDDPSYITTNPHIKTFSLTAIADIFTTFYNANYHPLTTLLFDIEFNLFGENAAPYHIISLLLHLANICLVYVLLDKLAGRKPIAIIGSLLFAIHPLHVESVAWISEQKDLLYGFFLLAGLIVYLKYMKEGGIKYAIAVFVLFLLSLLSKSAAVIFPLLLLAVDYYCGRKWTGRVLIEKIPFFALSIVFGVVTILSQKSAGAIATEMIPPYAPLQRFFVVSYALVYYITKLFLPLNLCAMHYAPKELAWYYYLSPVIIALIAVAVWKAKEMRRELVFGLLFYVFAIILVVQIIPVGYTVVAERYTYIPYIGLFFIIGFFYHKVMEGETAIFLRKYLNFIMAGIVLVFATLSFQRAGVWQNGVTLFEDVVEKYPGEAAGHFSLGKAEAGAGDTLRAIQSYNESLKLKPDYADVYFYRGIIYYFQKKYDPALRDYLKALELKPDFSEALYNTGALYYETGRNAEAIPYFSKTLAIHPTVNLYQLRGDAHFNLKKYQEAKDDYAQAIKLNPAAADAHYNLGASNFNLQLTDEACAEWKKASSLGYKKADELISAHCR